MTPRDVEQLRHRLQSIASAALRISQHAEDCHGLAYQPHVGDREKTSGGAWPPAGVEAVGDPRARELWARLDVNARRAEMTLRSLEWAMGNLLSRGGSADETRGSLISRREFTDAQTRQQRRADNGDYSPVRMVDQPPYPGGGA